MKTYPEVLAIYDSLVEKCEGIQRKGKTTPYTSANGYMFSFINKAGQLGFRFSETRKKELINTLDSSEFVSNNCVMKGYVLIPNGMMDKPEELKQFLMESFNYVKSLPAK